MEKQATISNEQKAHDLAVAYATYLACSYTSKTDLQSFYQDYENSYLALLPLIKRNA